MILPLHDCHTKILIASMFYDGDRYDNTVILNIVTAQPQAQPNSTSTQVGVDKVISWTTTTPPT